MKKYLYNLVDRSPWPLLSSLVIFFLNSLVLYMHKIKKLLNDWNNRVKLFRLLILVIFKVFIIFINYLRILFYRWVFFLVIVIVYFFYTIFKLINSVLKFYEIAINKIVISIIFLRWIYYFIG